MKQFVQGNAVSLFGRGFFLAGMAELSLMFTPCANSN